MGGQRMLAVGTRFDKLDFSRPIGKAATSETSARPFGHCTASHRVAHPRWQLPADSSWHLQVNDLLTMLGDGPDAW